MGQSQEPEMKFGVDVSEMNVPTDDQLKKMSGPELYLWVEDHNPNFSAKQREHLTEVVLAPKRRELQRTP
jgi:hypothetical protein